MTTSAVMTLIICFTLLAIFSLGMYTVIWMFTYDKEYHRKQIKRKINAATEAAQKEADALFEKNLELLAKKEKEIDLRIEEVIRENADLEEHNRFLKEQLELQQSVVEEEITPIEQVEEEE